jgi:hypothetical protein
LMLPLIFPVSPVFLFQEVIQCVLTNPLKLNLKV